MGKGYKEQGGLLIAISGPNASGKTTTRLALEARLRESGANVWSQKFPNYAGFEPYIDYDDSVWDAAVSMAPRRTGKFLNNVIHNGWGLSQWGVQQLCVEDRHDTLYSGVSGGLDGHMARGGVGVVEGWIIEAVVYARLKGGMSRDEVIRMNRGLPEPDVTFVLLPEVRVQARQKAGHMFETSNLDAIAGEVNVYREEAELSDLTTIDNRRPVHVMVEEMMGVINRIKVC